MPTEDNRDYRIRVDLTFPPDKEGAIRGMLQHILNQLKAAVNISPLESGFVQVQRCGHRLGLPCSILEEYKVEN